MADEESHEVRQPEARDHPGRAIADSSGLIEGRIEIGAGDFDTGRAVAGQKAIEPVRRPVERAAEIE